MKKKTNLENPIYRSGHLGYWEMPKVAHWAIKLNWFSMTHRTCLKDKCLDESPFQGIIDGIESWLLDYLRVLVEIYQNLTKIWYNKRQNIIFNTKISFSNLEIHNISTKLFKTGTQLKLSSGFQRMPKSVFFRYFCNLGVGLAKIGIT